MIRKHWINRYRPPETPESIKALTEELDPYGYESVLFTVHSRLGDMWTRLSSSVNKNHKFKYKKNLKSTTVIMAPQHSA